MNILSEVLLVVLICIISYFVSGRPDSVLPLFFGGVSGWVLVKLISRIWRSNQ